MRTRLVWLASLVSVVFVGLFVVWHAQRGRQIDKLTIEKIKLGMTESEMVLLVGMPPGDYRTASEQDELSRFDKSDWWSTQCAFGVALRSDDEGRTVRMDNPVGQCPSERTVKQWQTNLQVLYVIFDDHGIVTGFYFHCLGAYEDTSFEKLRRWLSF